MKYLVLGDPIIDKYIFGMVYRNSPEDNNIPVVDFVGEEYRLGGCLNVAANIKSLSHRYKDDVFVSCILSNFTANLLKNRDINCCDIIFDDYSRVPNAREIIKTRICNSETHKQFLRLDNRLLFEKTDVDKYKNIYFKDLNNKHCDAIIVSDYNKGTMDMDLINSLKHFDCPIFIDTKNKDLSIWDELNNVIIKINLKEWNEIQKQSRHPIIITKGKHGAILMSKRDETAILFSTQEVLNADVIGCGDVFLAGLVCEYARTKSLFDSIKFANIAARISAKTFGTVEVVRSDCEKELSDVSVMDS